MDPLLPTAPGNEDRHLPGRPEPMLHAPRPEPYVDEEVDLRDVWGILRRRRSTILGTFIFVLLAVGVYTWLKTPVWRSATLVRVDESDRSNVAVLDVIASLQRGSQLETEMRILRTRPIMEAVTDQLDLNVVVRRPAEIPRSVLFRNITADRSTPEADYTIRRLSPGRYRIESLGEKSASLRTEFAPGDTVTFPGGSFVLADVEAASLGRNAPDEIRFATAEFQDAVRDLGEELDVTRPDREANVIRVAYEGTDRVLVSRVPNAVAWNFIEQRQQVQKTEVRSTVAFLQEQSEILKGQLEAAEKELQSFREGRQIVALGTEATAQIERLAELQTQRTQLDAERNALANLIRKIDSETGHPEYRRLAAFPTFLNNEAIADILQNLTGADRARTELLTRVTVHHPDLVGLDRQIQQLEDQLGSIGRNYLSSLSDQIASLDAVLARFGSELEEIPAKEIQFARLERQTKLLAELYTLLQTRLKEAQVAEAVEDPAVRVVETAILPNEPVSPRPMRNMALAGILGLVLGVGLAFAREYLDNRIHSTEDVEGEFGVAGIGRIPTLPLSDGWMRRPGALVTLRTGAVGAEAFRTLRTNVRFVRGGAGAKEMVITSPGPQEGKSITAANLAVAFAQQGIRTLLIDADMRRSVQHFQFGIDREPGLADLLAGNGTSEAAIRPTEMEGLDLLPAGAAPPNPAELLGGPRIEELLARVREGYGAIVIDSPPVLAVTDAAVLGRKVEGVVMVVRAEQTHREAAAHALSQLRQVGATVLGLVLNDARSDGSYDYYRAYYEHTGGGRSWKWLLPFRG